MSNRRVLRYVKSKDGVKKWMKMTQYSPGRISCHFSTNRAIVPKWPDQSELTIPSLSKNYLLYSVLTAVKKFDSLCQCRYQEIWSEICQLPAIFSVRNVPLSDSTLPARVVIDTTWWIDPYYKTQAICVKLFVQWCLVQEKSNWIVSLHVKLFVLRCLAQGISNKIVSFDATICY